jgi:hypothetical protein
MAVSFVVTDLSCRENSFLGVSLEMEMWPFRDGL